MSHQSERAFSTRGMKLELSLNNVATKAAVMLLAVCACGLLIAAAASEFIVGTLTDERVAPSIPSLEAAARYFPNSARLHWRLAATLEQQGDLSSAHEHILRAIAQSPCNYRFATTLASIEESRGDYEQAEQSLRDAVKLAPNKAEVHWSLANLLLRTGDVDSSLEEFRTAATLKPSLLPATLNLVWRASNGSIEALMGITSNESAARISLAKFLLNHSRPAEATDVLNAVDRQTRLASPQCAALLNALVDSKNLALARSTWAKTVGVDDPPSLIWNGGFESDRVDGFTQFDWAIRRSDYARAGIVRNTAHAGARCLRLEFEGRDTTRLDNEVQQLVVVKPGARYRLECYAKADGLMTPEGPRLVVSTAPSGSGPWLANSQPVAAVANDWQHLETDFVAPLSADGAAVGLYVSIKRRPAFSYDEPTRGSIYFDDFALTEQMPVGNDLAAPAKPHRARGNGTL